MSPKLERQASDLKAPLGDLVRRVSYLYNAKPGIPERWIGADHLSEDDLRIRRWSTTDDPMFPPTFKFRFDQGAILIHSRNPRKVAIADFPAITGEKLFALAPVDPSVLDAHYLAYLLKTDDFVRFVTERSVGSVNKFLNWGALAEYDVILPPLVEQRRVVSALQSVDHYSQSLTRLGDSLRHVVSSRLDGYLASSEFRNSRIPVAEILRESPKNGLSPTTNSDGLGLRTVSLSAISDGEFRPEGNVKFAEVDNGKADRFMIRAGDIFAIRGNGNRYLTGKAGIAVVDYDDMFYPDLMIRLRFDEELVIPTFALWQWNLPSVHRRLVARAKSSNGIWKVNGQDIRDHTLTLPSLQQQQQLVGELAVLQDQQKECQARRSILMNIKAAVLQQLRGDTDV